MIRSGIVNNLLAMKENTEIRMLFVFRNMKACIVFIEFCLEEASSIPIFHEEIYGLSFDDWLIGSGAGDRG